MFVRPNIKPNIHIKDFLCMRYIISGQHSIYPEKSNITDESIVAKGESMPKQFLSLIFNS